MTTLTGEAGTPPSQDDIAEVLVASVEFLPVVEQQLASLLAVAVSCSALDLAHAAREVWGELPGADAVDSLHRHPLIESVGERLRVVAPLDIALARRFRDSDPERFAAAHSVFASLEEEHSETAPANELEAWQTHARIAYYMLNFTEAESGSAFIDSFDSSPASSRRACRLWLSGLAIRYAGITGVHNRVGDFFVAFRYYLAGDRERARPLLEELLDSDRSDKIAAVSLHLLAMCLDSRREEQRRLALLDDSIRLSAALGVRENLMMARNSAIFSRLAASRRRNDSNAAAIALTLARENDELALEIGDPVFRTAARRALAVVEWRTLTGPEREKALERVLSVLREAQLEAERAYDLGSWVLAAIAAADCFQTLERFTEALDELEAAVLEVETAVAFADLPRRQFFDQLDRICERVRDTSELSERCEALERRFRVALRRSP